MVESKSTSRENGSSVHDSNVSNSKDVAESTGDASERSKLSNEVIEEYKCNVNEVKSSNMMKQVSSESSKLSVREMVELYEVVSGSGIPNYKGCRIPVPIGKKLNMDLWRERLVSYEDKVVCEFLQFGFPLDFDRKAKLNFNERRNHRGARDFPAVINEYLTRECDDLRIVGPFNRNPLSSPLMISPLNSVPKDDLDERRIIVDLSWPHGSSVNDGISKDHYLGEIIELHYASVTEVCRMAMEVGKGAVIYKRDLRRAYRQVPVDPRDYCYLGYCWEDKYFFDTVLCMGQRNAAMACSRTTRAVMYMHHQKGHLGTSYLDDLIGVSSPETGMDAYESLGTLLLDLGLVENLKKACPPSTSQIVLGVLVDTINGIIAVPDDKMEEIHLLLPIWKRKRKCNKVDLQSLIGKLQFVSKCVRQSRIFVNRLLDTLRSFSSEKVKISLSKSFKKDINWWCLFMSKFNGVSYIPPEIWEEPDVLFSTDSCLTGCGGVCGREYFHRTYPMSILQMEFPIHKLEMLAVLVAVRFWARQCTGGKIQIFCDNESVVHVLNSGKTKDDFLGSCLREIWLEVSMAGFELRAIHLPGVDNRVADWLSRWELHPKYKHEFYKYIGDEVFVELEVTLDMFEFSDKI